MESTQPPRDIVELNNSMLWMCKSLLHKDKFEECHGIVEKFKKNSVTMALVCMSFIEMSFDADNLEALVGKEVYGLFCSVRNESWALQSYRIEPKLVYIALNQGSSTKVMNVVSKTFDLKAVQAHTDNAWYFLPKNSMPVEKQMGLDKPTSTQRIMALEKEVKDLKKELEAIKAIVGNRI